MIYKPPRQGFILRRKRRGGGTPRLLLLLFQVNELTRFVRGPSGAPACWGRGLTHIHGDARNERRGGYVSQATRCLPDPAAFQSLCAVQQRRKGQVLRAAASLLHAAAYGLRASLAGNQQAGALPINRARVSDFTCLRYRFHVLSTDPKSRCPGRHQAGRR